MAARERRGGAVGFFIGGTKERPAHAARASTARTDAWRRHRTVASV